MKFQLEADAADAKAKDRPSELIAKVYATILNRLVSREIEPGDRISVDAIAREFGISQTPLRQALNQLEVNGLVIKTHLSGYRAAPPFDRKDFEDLYTLRRLLEPKIAAEAALHASSLDNARLDEISNDSSALLRKRNQSKFDFFAKCDVDFHMALAEASGNRFFKSTAKGWSLQFHLFRRSQDPQWLSAVIEEHGVIAEAIRLGRPEEAEAAMIMHLRNSYARYRETVKRA